MESYIADPSTILLDSNAVTHYLSGVLTATATKFINEVIDEGAIISVLTKIELLGFNAQSQMLFCFRNLLSRVASLICQNRLLTKQLLFGSQEASDYQTPLLRLPR